MKASTAFEVRVSNNEWDNLCNIAAKFQASSADAECFAGALVVRGDRLPCEGFTAQSIYNDNAYYVEAATSAVTADDVVYACNTYDSQLIGNGTNNWHIGHETLGIPTPAGRIGTYTKVVFNGENIYRFGEGNTDDAGSADFYTIDAGALVSADSAPTSAGTVYFKTVGTGKFTVGTTDAFGYVDVQACKVTA